MVGLVRKEKGVDKSGLILDVECVLISKGGSQQLRGIKKRY